MKLIEQQVLALLEEEDFIAATSNLSAFLFQEFKGLNWAGFYFVKNDNLVLGPFQGKVACTHIPFNKGVCGKCYREKACINIPDVLAIQDHIACDSTSRSELCAPILIQDQCVALIDMDAPVQNHFSIEDEQKVLLIAHLYEKAIQEHHWY